MDRFTLIVVPEGTGSVRRFRVRRTWLTQIVAVSVVAAGVVGWGTHDWLRLRREVEASRHLRAEVQAQRARLSGFEARASSFASELERLAEFERRVRVIANLPARTAEADQPVSPRSFARDGVGGGAETPEGATPPIGVPTGANALSAETPAPAPKDPAKLEEHGAVDSVSKRWDPLERRTAELYEHAIARAGTLETLVAELQGKGDRLAATPSIWPTRGWLTSRHGWRISPFTGKRDMHEGIDIAADFGAPVAAPANGKVSFVGTMGPLGNAVVVEHGHGIKTTYGHLRDTKVRAGDTVTRGQVIATVGSSGRSTGPHLHYVVNAGNKNVDPLDYVVD